MLFERKFKQAYSRVFYLLCVVRLTEIFPCLCCYVKKTNEAILFHAVMFIARSNIRHKF